MKRLYPLFALVVVLTVGTGVLYALWWLGSGVIAFLSSFESEVAAALVATSGTVLIAVITLVLNQRESKKREAREAHRAEKVAIYKRFMEKAVVEVLRRSIEGEELSEEEMIAKYQDFFLTFTADLIVWGSPGVIQAFRKFRAGSAEAGQNVLVLMDGILREIRRDLGNSNWGIAKGDLISTFLKDPSELKKLIGAQTSRDA